MVAGPWKWDMAYMVTHFGWKAALAIAISNALYFFIFRRELTQLEKDFTLTRIKDDIQRTYIKRSEFEDEFERTGVELSEELGFRWAVESRYAAL